MATTDTVIFSAIRDLFVGFLRLTALTGGLGIAVIVVWVIAIIVDEHEKKNKI